MLATWFRAPIAVPVVATVMLVVHLSFAGTSYPLLARVGAAVLGTLAFAVIQRTRNQALPFVAVATLTQYVFFGLPVFRNSRLVGVNGPIPLSQASISAAVWAVILFTVVMIASARVAQAVGTGLAPAVARLFPRNAAAQSRIGLRLCSILSLGIMTVVWLIGLKGKGASSIATVASLFAGQQLFQTLLYRDARETRSATARAWFVGYTVVGSVAGLLTGMLGTALIPWLGALVLSWQATGRVNVRAIALLLAAFVVLTPAKHLFRSQMSRAGDVTVSERVDVMQDAVEEAWGGQQRKSGQVDAAADRLSALLFVAQAIEWVPRYVKHSGSSRWKLIPVSYVPRAFWPAKPDLTRAYNGEYSLTFGLQTEVGLRTTTMNLPHVLDGYWAYGWAGVIAVGIMIGGLIGFYQGVFDPTHPVLHALGMTYLLQMHGEAHVGAFFTGIPQVFLVGFAIFWTLWLLRAFVPDR